MTAKRHERTHARRAALQVLYTSEITDASPADIADRKSYLSEDGLLPEYAEAVLRGVAEHREAIDRHLSATSENWSLNRMPIVDRSILRLATYEMMYVDDVPTSVTINEAVELAKDFGGEDESPRFVNGVLGRIAKRLEEGEAVEEPAAESAPETVEEPAAESAPEAAAEPAAPSAEAASLPSAIQDAPEAEGASGEEAPHGE